MMLKFGLAAVSAAVLAGCGGGLLYQERFACGLADWYVEGGRRVEVEDGQLIIDADPENPAFDGSSGESCTVWNRLRLEGDFRIEFDVTIVHSYPSKNNINFFLLYTMPDGSSPEATTARRRNAAYADYHRIPGYIFTFVNGSNERGEARLRIRRCPGFRLLAETFASRSESGREYRFAITRRGGELDFEVDGELLLRARDEEPLASGYFGFRTFRTKLRIGQLTGRRLD